METRDLDLKGETILKIVIERVGDDPNSTHENDIITFWTNSGFKYHMTHTQDCCESVNIDDIEGDLNDLIDSPLLQSEVATSSDEGNCSESCTWTFYRFATIKGYVTMKWFGSSNGYYSESVEMNGYKDEDTVQKIRAELREKKINKLI